VKGGLLLRTAIASGLLTILVGGAFAVLLVAVDDLRASARMESLSEAELDASDRLERLAADLETGVRGFVITRQEQFLQPFNAARATFPGQIAALEPNEVNRRQAQRLRSIARDVAAYIDDYALPVIRAARAGRPSARSAETTAAGKRRTDAIRAQFDGYRATQLGLRSMRLGQDDALTQTAVVAATVGLSGSILLIVVFSGYLGRALLLPVRRAAAMADRLAGGDLSVRIPETGRGEVGALEHAFNTMAGSLETSRDELRLLVDEQSALRRVATLVARGVSPAQLFDSVAAETLALMGADAARVCRYEADATATVVADCNKVAETIAVGTRLTLEGESVTASVLRTRRPSRRESFDGATGAIVELARERGLRSAVGGPIVVEGRVWGVILAYWTRPGPLPEDAEDRIAEFAELVATAIANADSRDELVASRARVLAAADNARRHVVRDLHDGAQQHLVNTIVTLKLAKRALPGDDARAEALVDRALGQAEEANTELRELAHGILPGVLTAGGLEAGVDALASRLDVPVTLDVSAPRLEPGIEASAYFVIAEALTNIVKHSHAGSAEVKARVTGGELRVDVSDDGVGGARADGAGLMGLEDRVAALGGRLRVHSTAAGTVITATLPLPI
jgi:signal transduction histidine kinase/CHASE3 domain sensor protein